MQLEEFQELCGANINVSRESFDKLEQYHVLLEKWQKAINLVSSNSISGAWQRHFADSAQVVRLIPDNAKKIVDLGSGGGFPALVLAILRPDLELHLVESDERKAQFLRRVSRETGCGAVVHNERVEAVIGELSPDLIMARAFAPLGDILDYCAPLFHVKQCVVPLLLMKGRDYEREVAEARKSYDFKLVAHPSITDPRAVILSLTDVCKL